MPPPKTERRPAAIRAELELNSKRSDPDLTPPAAESKIAPDWLLPGAGNGDNCGVCGRTYTDGAALVVGWIGSRRAIAGPCCGHRIERAEAVGINFGAEPPWRIDDRLWFARHADRRHRLRTAYPGEAEARGHPPTSTTHVLLRQIRPGKRVALLLSRPGEFYRDDESTLCALWERAIERLSARGAA